MLPSGYRMRRRDEFVGTVRRGRRAGRRTLVLHLVRGDDPYATPAVGFTVGRAVGGAVVRNRIRRRLRHLVRERLDALPAGSLLVVRANREAVDAKGDQLAADLDSALERLLRRPPRGRGPR